MLALEPLLRADPRTRTRFLDGCSRAQLRAIHDAASDFPRYWARPAQIWPTSAWKIWVLSAGRGFGKLLGLNTPVPTPEGWSSIGEIEPGAVIFDETGRPTRVLATFDALPARAYRLTFSDGEQVEACGDHQWVTWTHAERKAYLRSAYEADRCRFPADWPAWRGLRRTGAVRLPTALITEALALHRTELYSVREIARKLGCERAALNRHLRAGHIVEREPRLYADALGPRVRTTAQIVETFTHGKRGDRNHCIPLAAPLELPERALPLDPYVLGYWLGDGTSADGTFTVGPTDRDALCAVLQRAGFAPHPIDRVNTLATYGLWVRLVALGVARNKHVPAAYLRGSIAQREALLAGLLDSDGFCDRTSGHIEFTNMNRGLADAVVELARSLGEKPVLGTGRATLYGRDCGAKYRVTWRPNRNPFRLARKAARVQAIGAQGLRNAHRMIVDWEEIAPEPMRCLTVDSPHSLFLVGRGMIPTHNTKVGAEYTHRVARQNPGRHLALVARTSSDARDTMIEGESGILHTGWPTWRPIYSPTKRRVTWPNGCWGTVYTADEPDNLRGPNCCWFWADELASWRYARKAWDMLMFTLRTGSDPRGIVTTTPKPTPIYREILADPGSVVTRGSTWDNAANLAPSFLAYLKRKYAGTTLGRQELEAEVLDQAEGALWQRAWLERDRVTPDQVPEHLDRIVVAIDPSATSTEESSEAGIVVVGAKYHSGPVPDDFYVLADVSGTLSPHAWARRAVEAYEAHRADRVIGEANHGGDMIETVLRTAAPNLPYRQVRASEGKRARAEPVSALSEQHRLHMVGFLAELEDQLCNWDPNVTKKSPDRLDAMVWAVTDLMARRAPAHFDLGGQQSLVRSSHWSLPTDPEE